MHPHRHKGPKSTQYKELESILNQFHECLRKKRYDNAEKVGTSIRKLVLLNGCPEDDIVPESKNDNNAKKEDQFLTRIGHQLPTIRNVEDTLRGRLWRLVLGISALDANNYKTIIKKAESHKYYVKIRGDTKRTFLTSREYNSRVSEERLVRVLNSFVMQYNKPYCQGMDAIAAGILYVMPELGAFASFSSLMNHHFPTYFYSDRHRKKDLIGAYAGSYLSWDILKVCDREIFNHLKCLPAHTYLFPLVASFQAISQPFTQLLRLWDFLFCFGVHLNPILAAAQIIHNKKIIMGQPPARLLQTVLSQRKWMNQRLDARGCIDCTMTLIMILKQDKHKKLWKRITAHASNFEVALQIKNKHTNVSGSMKTITTANISSSSVSTSKSKNNGKENKDKKELSKMKITDDDIMESLHNGSSGSNGANKD